MNAVIDGIQLGKGVKDMRGQVFNRLTVTKHLGVTPRGAIWRCKCICGKETDAYTGDLRSGHKKSCGCLFHEKAGAHLRKHGKYLTPEYGSWQGMIKRCTNPNHKSFSRYGGRGITIDPRWMDIANFLADMGPRPSPDHTIDRIDNNGNYEPGNVRWATRSEQQRNMRSNHLVTYKGETMPLVAWAERLGFKPHSLQSRLALGWSIERAFKTPMAEALGIHKKAPPVLPSEAINDLQQY